MGSMQIEETRWERCVIDKQNIVRKLKEYKNQWNEVNATIFSELFRKQIKINEQIYAKIRMYAKEFNEHFNSLNIAIFACLVGLVIIVGFIHMPHKIGVIFNIFKNYHRLWIILVGLFILTVLKFQIYRLLSSKIVNELDRALWFGICLATTLSFMPLPIQQFKTTSIVSIIVLAICMLFRIYRTQAKLKMEKSYAANKNAYHLTLDEPTNNDKLNRDVIIDDLRTTIKEIDFSERVVLGITGKWGSGKSSVWEIAKKGFDDSKVGFGDGFIIIDFDPWKMDTKEAIIQNLMTAITSNKQLGFNLANSQQVVNAFVRYMLGTVKTPFNGLFNPIDNKKKFDSFFADLSKHLIQQDKHLILTIDNLDRISGDNAFMLVSTINSIGQLKNIIIILLYDELELERKFEKLAIGQNYMDKLVNKKLVVPLPDTMALMGEFIDILHDALDAHNVKYKNDEIGKFAEKINEIGGTVREFKNFVSNLPMEYLPIDDNDMYSRFFLQDLLVIEYIKTTNASAYSELGINRNMIVDIDFQNNEKYARNENARAKEKAEYYNMFAEKYPKEFRLLGLVIPTIDYYLYNQNGYADANNENLNFLRLVEKKYATKFKYVDKEHRIFSGQYVDWYFKYNAVESLIYRDYISPIINKDSKKPILDVIKIIADNSSFIKNIIFSEFLKKKYLDDVPSKEDFIT